MIKVPRSMWAHTRQRNYSGHAQEIDVAVLKKAQDIQDQQGKQAMQLIASSVVSANKVDVYV